MFAQSYNKEALGLSSAMREFAENLRHDVLEDTDREELVEKARELYCGGTECDLEVDSDAAFSESDDGVWVSGWFYVPNEDDEDDDTDDDET
jgi:hypothetical protein